MTRFTPQSPAYKNDLDRSLGALLGIAQGMLCDQHLNDAEIRFLAKWLDENESIASAWPGDVVRSRVRAVLEDGVVTEAERQHLTETLQHLMDGTLQDIDPGGHLAGLAFDEPASIAFPQARFCLTGDFVYAPRDVCAATIERRGGMVSSSITRKLNYLVVGGLGSREWGPGSFGAKVEKALEYKRDGAPILIVHEDRWASALA
jgi:NAD-dependent DNA ligase